MDIFHLCNINSLTAFHSSPELHEFISTMDALNLSNEEDCLTWTLSLINEFAVKNYYEFLNDGGLRSDF